MAAAATVTLFQWRRFQEFEIKLKHLYRAKQLYDLEFGYINSQLGALSTNYFCLKQK